MSVWKDWYKNADKESLILKLNPDFKVTVTPILYGCPLEDELFDIGFKNGTWTVCTRDHVLFRLAIELHKRVGIKFWELTHSDPDPGFKVDQFTEFGDLDLWDEERESLIWKFDHLFVS